MNNSFSVIIPLYNKALFIKRAIDSILCQTIQDFEILVVDDCSTDNGIEVVQAFKDDRIRLIRQETNRGVSAARNRGIAEAKFEWIAFLDSDDEWKPDFLETLVGLQEMYPGCGAYATSYEYHFENSDKVTFCMVKNLPQKWTGVIENYFALAASVSFFCTDSVSVSRRVLKDVEGFPEGISHGEDRYIWAVVALNSSIAYKNESHAIYHRDIPGQLSMSVADFQGEAIKMLIERYQQGKIPQKKLASFLDYIFSRIVIGTRNLILIEKNGKKARELLNLNPKEKLQISQLSLFCWLYFWSYAPHIFKRMVVLKEAVKSRLLV